MNAQDFSKASFWIAAWLLVGDCGAAGAQAAAQRPNILWITCEDISPDLGCYGDSFAVTPNLDRLAQQGVRYTNAFAMGSVCTPSRSCLITGVYPTSLGSQHLRGPIRLPENIRCFTEYLRQAGYYCSNNFKQDYNFTAPRGSWDESSTQAHWRKRQPGQPFFSVFNIMTTHQGQIRAPEEQFAAQTARLTPQERHDPAKVPLPPYYPDTPLVRRDLARFYDLVTAMDQQAGDLLRQLEEDGLDGDTIVFFYSDHGSGMPRHKRALYDSGIRVPLVIRFPQKHRQWAPGKPGAVVDRLVSFVDFAPTVLSLLGVKIPDYMPGQVFLGPEAAQPRQYVIAIRDRVDECYELIRAVRDQRYKYLRNYMPHRPYMQLSDYCEPAPTVQELRRLAAEGKLTGPQKLYISPTKPPEELYDTQNDPDELHNLADSPDHQQVLGRMRQVLRAWMIDTHDTGLLPEAEMLLRSGGDAPYDMARQPDRFPVERILAAAELVGRGPECDAKLAALLQDPDSAVRYWAAVGLTAPGADARPAAEALCRALGDPAPTVRFAAAEALCRIGRDSDALPVLVAGLQCPQSWIRLHAASVLVAIGQKARPAVPEMTRLIHDPSTDEHAVFTRWALGHVFRELHLDPAKAGK